MKSNLHINNSSFTYQEGFSIEDLEPRIERFLSLINRAKENDDRVCKNDSVYDVEFFEDRKVYEILYTNTDVTIGEEHKKALKKILDRAANCADDDSDISAMLDSHDNENVYGFLCLNDVGHSEAIYYVCSIEDWYAFHRHFLALYPVSDNNFINECPKYFDRLFFHARVATTLSSLDGGLERFSNTIVKNLTALNDELLNYNDARDRVSSLRRFSSACEVDATPEGDASRKPDFTFDFMNANNEPEPVCCEPHLKLSRSNSAGDTHHYNNRIYFHEGKPNIANGKILVGHIGSHL